MIPMGSIFFREFSLRDLVEKNYPGATIPPSGGMGSVGGGHGIAGSAKSSHHKSETFSFSIQLTGEARFDEPEFIASVRLFVKERIVEGGANVQEEGAIDSSAFYFDYSHGDIGGRIEIRGKMIALNYVLAAQIEENAEGKPRLQFAAVQSMPPRGEYNVVVLTGDDSLEQANEFFDAGRRLIQESVDRMRRVPVRKLPTNSQSAEVFSLFTVSRQIREALDEETAAALEPPAEYRDYERVFFLNDVALKMYEDAGIVLDVLRKVAAAEMPPHCLQTLRGPYLAGH